MPRVALLSVGNIVGKSEEPVKFFLNAVKPDYVYLFISQDSQDLAKSIISETYLDSDAVEYCPLADPFDINSCYQVVTDAFQNAVDKTSQAWFHIDLTTGTKPMAFALILKTFQLLDDTQIDGRFNISYIKKSADPNNPMQLIYLPDERLKGGKM